MFKYHRHIINSIVIAIYLAVSGFSEIVQQEVICLTAEEQKLYDLINQYRTLNGLGKIPLSVKLTEVAKAHSLDLDKNFDVGQGNICNMHSWSGKVKGFPCCYTDDHKDPQCMWDKPRQINGYPGNGYEIAYFHSSKATAEESLESWQTSDAHNPVILNTGQWEIAEWKAIGVGIHGSYATVWFGMESDASLVMKCK